MPKKEIARNIFRQAIISIIIFILLMLLMSFSAYFSIAKHRIQEFLGIDSSEEITEILDNETDTFDDLEDIEIISEFSEEKNTDIPDMNFDISPLSDRIIIPEINQNVPVIKVSSENLINRDFKALEQDIQEALRSGVVHYPGTGYPGDGGNVVITGHSSYFPWDSGRFKDVFALLHDVELEDKIYVYHNQKKYVYEITEIFEVKPDNIDVLKQTKDERLTLITCTPIGTNLRRLIIIAEPL